MNLRQTIKRVLREETKKSLTPIIQSLLNYYVEDYKDILCKVEVTPPNQDDENQNPISFQNVITSNVTLNSTQLDGWGVDDSYILTQIASLMDTSVVSYVTISEA